MKSSSFNGYIETNNIVGDYYGLRAGGIAGFLEAVGDIGIDNSHVDAYFKIIAENSKIGGIVGQADKSTQYIQNSIARIDLDLLSGDINNDSYYGGIVGYAYYSTNLDSVTYIVNNSARTNYLQTTALQSARKRYIGGISGYGGAIVNNFASDTKVTPEATNLSPLAIVGNYGYVYETYWNADTMGLTIGAANTYADASAEPYTFNLEGIPVTRNAKTVLGLLRYNAGYDGGVISAHVPANSDAKYHNWTTENDADGHVIPVPADK